MNDSYGIYIHIPFCVKKCNYCDFCSGKFSEQIKREYIDKLIDEINSKLKKKTILVDSVFIGGGTPSILESNQIERIMNALYCNASITDDCEITIECNPGTVDYDKLLHYKKIGINRISFGMQSANDNELKTLGRIHTFEEFKESFNLARKAGFENINIDVMSAIPDQTVESFKKTLNLIKELNPEHVSVYSLIIEEGTSFYDMDLNLVSEDEEREMVELTAELLSPVYKQYEISNYSKPGFECKHNIKYWTRKPYLGFGVAAASLENNIRYKNTTDINEYLNSIGKYEEYEELSLDDEISEHIFLGLRMNRGISVTEIKELYNIDVFDIFSSVINKHSKEGLLVIEGDKLYLSSKGRDLCNYVCSDFIV